MKRELPPDPVEVAESAGAEVIGLERRDRWKLMQKWRETFAKNVKDRTGKWVYQGCHWHTFSFSWKFTKAKEGARALDLYLKETNTELVVIPESEEEEAFRIQGCVPIDFSPSGRDLYVFPLSFQWTMAFTHEQPDTGPFFCRKEWGQIAGK